jgi:DNA-directed RNA polymerase subunit RPC12/RpoP
MTNYKSHYACFECKKTFKRKRIWDINRDDKRTVEAKCPQCGQLMANMGLDFASPKKDNVKEWQHIKDLYSVGITFHSCGCTGPGYIPKTAEKLIAYFKELLVDYNRNLNFWRQRDEPTDEKQLNREISKNWNYINKVYHLRPQKGVIKNEDAKNYWFDKIKNVEAKIDKITTANN